MWKNYVLISCFGLLSMQVMRAQGVPLDLWVTTGVSSFHSKSFSQFTESFNSYNAGVIATPLGGFGPRTCINWGATIVFGDAVDDDEGELIEFSLYASNLRGKGQVKYTDDSKRVFDLRRHFLGFEMGAGYRWGRLGVTGSWGALFGNTVLSSYYVYPNGTKSFGQEKIFNGVYDGFNIGGFLGAKATYRVGSMKLLAHFTWGGDLFRRFYLRDQSVARTLNVSQGTWPSELPTDVATWSDNASNNEIYNGTYVENRFGSFGLQLGIAYSFARE